MRCQVGGDVVGVEDEAAGRVEEEEDAATC